MILKNKDQFIAFLKKHLKNGVDVDAHLELLERTIRETDSCDYELAGYYTKSGRPEYISFDVKRIFLVNDEWIDEETFNNGDYEEFDDYEIEVTF